MSRTAFANAPPSFKEEVIKLSFPAEHVLHVAMHRVANLNAMSHSLNDALTQTFDWFENEPSLYVAILGSTSQRAWCAGADLIEIKTKGRLNYSKHGFGGITTRYTRKPIIGAVNGYAMGGGSEMVVNLDIVIAGKTATFGFPEVKRGVSISAGGLPRFVRLVGHQKACEYMLTGRNIPAEEAKSLRMVNEVVDNDEVEPRALFIAKQIASNSPDSLICLLHAIRLTNQLGSVDEAYALSESSAEMRAVWQGENIQEGLSAFQQKRLPIWRPSKL